MVIHYYKNSYSYLVTIIIIYVLICFKEDLIIIFSFLEDYIIQMV